MINALLHAAAFLAGASPELLNAMPLHAPGGWQVDVGPGSVSIAGREIALPDPVRLIVPEPAPVTVRGEAQMLPLFNPQAGGWLKGARLKALIAQECTATGLLQPETVVVRSASGVPFARDVDYALDPLWGTIGRLEAGSIGADESVLIDYTWSPARLDAIVVNTSGQVRLIEGTPGLGFDPPPAPGVGEFAIGSVWNPGNAPDLTAENLLPVEHSVAEPTPPEYYAAEQFLPKTLAKLEAGEPVTIVAWGDSVTNGGGVGGDTALWYQNQFVDRLRARYPDADIKLHTAAWPGRGSRDYLEAPPGGPYDFQRDVLDRKPDLVTAEWVNDAYLRGEALTAHYTTILEHLRGAGAELVLITPHLVRPDWMGVDTLKFDEDPRPYVQGLRAFAEANDVAVADASRIWCGLWRRGIPYTTLLANAINHPDARGQAIFADALMALFPE
ncbi:MAG: hypothetical protein KF886_13180 [Candidatus Hydrogenedentes bacterium]|nr:hypothetical protein [Candidatus Hydrogenedentota bacterium]